MSDFKIFQHKYLFTLAKFGLILIFGLVLVFHLCVLLNIVPIDRVWGGKIADTTNIYLVESIALGLVLVMLMTVLLKTQVIKNSFSPKTLRNILYAMLLFFILNTVGNLLSENSIEKMVAAPVTLLITFLLLVLVLYQQD